MSRGGPSCPVTKMLPPPHLRAGSSIGSDWGLLPLLYQVTMAQRGNGNSNGNGNGNGNMILFEMKTSIATAERSMFRETAERPYLKMKIHHFGAERYPPRHYTTSDTEV